MGVATYLVPGDAGFPSRMDKLDYAAIDLIGVICKGLDSIQLSTLNSIITGTPYDPDFMMTDASMVYVKSQEEGPWLIIFPHEFVALLAEIEDGSVPSIISKWVETDEFRTPFVHDPEGDARCYLSALIEQAKKCVDRKWSLYLYVSL